MACSKEIKYSLGERKKIAEVENKICFDEGQQIAGELVQLLNDGIPLRQERIARLRRVANKIDTATDLTNCTSIVLGVADGILLVKDIGLMFVTFDPLNAAEIDVLLDKDKTAECEKISCHKVCTNAQIYLQTYKATVAEIRKKEERLRQKGAEIHETDVNTVCLCFFVGNQLKNAVMSLTRHESKVASQLTKSTSKTAEAFAASFAKAINGATGLILKKKILSDIRILQKHCITDDLHTLFEGCVFGDVWPKNTITSLLRTLADVQEEDLTALESFNRDLRKLRKTFKENIKKEFKNLCRCISARGHPTDDETKQMMEYIETYSPREFREALKTNDILERGYNEALSTSRTNFEDLVFEIAHICNLIENDFTNAANIVGEDEIMNVTIIGHGHIRPPIISHLHYLSRKIDAVKLYAPWGCAIHANVAHGIATGTIRIDTVRYSKRVYPEKPTGWNKLPINTNLVPSILMSPIAVGSNQLALLQQYKTNLPAPYKGLVIFYVNNEGIGLQYNTVPFWIICGSIGLLASLYDKVCRIHNATCLIVNKRVQNLESNGQLYDPQTRRVKEFGYCSVDVEPIAVMRHIIADEDRTNVLDQIMTLIDSIISGTLVAD